MEASWAILERSWGPLGPSWSIGDPKRREGEKPMGNQRFWPPGPLPGGLLEASWGILAASWAVLGPSWASWGALWASRGPLGPPSAPLRALLARLGALLGPKKSCGKLRRDAGSPRAHATSPGRFRNLGSGPLKESSGLRTEAQGMSERTLEHAQRARGTVADPYSSQGSYTTASCRICGEVGARRIGVSASPCERCICHERRHHGHGRQYPGLRGRGRAEERSEDGGQV